MDSKVTLTKKNPQDDANIFSKIMLTWSFGLFRSGFRRDLQQEELYRPRVQDHSGGLGDRLEAAWAAEVRRAADSGGRPSLGRCIVRVFWLRYMIWGLFVGLLFVFMWPMIPFVLSRFIAYFSGSKTAADYRDAHVYSFLLNALSVGTAIVMNHVNLGQGAVGMQIRIACCSLVYRKLLKLSRASLGKTTPGQIINLMSNDVNRFDMVPLYLHFIWVMPIVVPVVCYLVWQHIGYATLAALCVILLQSVLVQGYLSREQGVLRGKIARRTDERVRVMSELVSGVQVIKMYAWEQPFEKLVATLRKLEVNLIQKTSMIKGFSVALTVFTERFILYAAVVTFVAAGGAIRSEITFSLVQYFNLLQLACNIFFPMALSAFSEARVSMQRLEEFLRLEELAGEKVPEKPELVAKPTPLMMVKASASWLPDPIVPTLRCITLTVPPGQFLGVAGPVGAGKSSLLQVILGELQLSQGSISLGGARVSYAAQEPWLFVASVRQNILFGLPYDRVRYKKVVAACALLRDFELLPHGDSTLVGERGISLSGGQRARIGLARAVYRQADIYLLDDPLSAVDTHVGKQLLNDCVNGFLRAHTRILVTHQLHHLSSADNIIVLRNGEVETEGTFEVVSKNPLFSELLQEDSAEDDAKPRARTRTLSVQSHSSVSTVADVMSGVDEGAEPGETSELMEKGRVSGSVYLKYFRTGGGWALLTFTALSVVAAQVVTSASDLWLTNWMNAVETEAERSQNFTALFESPILNDSSPFVNSSTSFNNGTGPALDSTSPTLEVTTTVASMVFNDTEVDLNKTVLATMLKTAATLADTPWQYGDVRHDFYVYVWTALIFGCILVTTERSLLFLWVCMRSSVGMHNTMFRNILHATMRFFDTNPSGRILNRFSKDMGMVDEVLPRIMLESLQIFMVMFGILIMVAIVSPYMLLTTACCAVVMYFITIVYLNTGQAIKRLEGVTRSPVFSHVTASMAGLSTVRACGAQDMLRASFDSKQDVHTGAWYLMLVTNTAFAIWLSMVSALYVIVVAYTFLLTDDGTTKSGNVGLAISQALIMVNMVQYGIKQSTEVISQMTSVERIAQYTRLPQETPLRSPPGAAPPAAWPTRARIVFRDLYLRYSEDGEPVLRNLNIVVESGWKVGVVGRTGAGKSSLISALFRLAVLDGDVVIDDINTRDIGLQDLRSKLSIIPQEPVLFSASLRYNLDPFDKYTDADIWKALEQVELKQSVTSLSSEVTEGGGNYSAGQRQLLCLARAALTRNRVLVLDEATANVDPKTDMLIQKTIRTAFADCTVLTVAHRLHTVADSDRVLVMDAGQAVQFGHPHELLQQRGGMFALMVEQLGAASEANLREIAQQAYDRHIQYADADAASAPRTD